MGRRKVEDIGTETARAASAFEVYYQLGAKRSLRALAEQDVADVRQVDAWSARYDWQNRVAARQAEEFAAAGSATHAKLAIPTGGRIDDLCQGRAAKARP